MSIHCIAIIHYHLQPGGVTKVIGTSLKMLDAVGVRAVVLVGSGPDCGADFSHDRIVVVPGLGYGMPQDLPAAGNALREALESAAVAGLGRLPDVWHVHNHSLGKNPALTWAVSEMARAGRPLLLQIHDFAEDGRPALHDRLWSLVSDQGLDPGGVVYPNAPNVHYAVLNRRDLEVMRTAGLAPAQCHYLPNPVLPAESLPAAVRDDGRENLYVYPVRAIRRKNLGECLLLAALSEDTARFAVTMAPRNPEQLPVYDFWVARSRDLGLPVEFDVGGNTHLRSIMRQATAAVNTSVSEGFGLGFIEPWLLGRAVTGRDLPEVTADFRRAGVELQGLYPSLDIPTEAFDRAAFGVRLREAYYETCRAYRREPEHDLLDALVAQIAGGDRVDFGRLDETAQAEALSAIIASDTLRGRIKPFKSLLVPGSRALIKRNAGRILEYFGESAFVKRLLYACRAVQAGNKLPSNRINASVVLDRFLSPERFFMVNAARVHGSWTPKDTGRISNIQQGMANVQVGER